MYLDQYAAQSCNGGCTYNSAYSINENYSRTVPKTENFDPVSLAVGAGAGVLIWEVAKKLMSGGGGHGGH